MKKEFDMVADFFGKLVRNFSEDETGNTDDRQMKDLLFVLLIGVNGEQYDTSLLSTVCDLLVAL